jgi:ribonuclease HI
MRPHLLKCWAILIFIFFCNIVHSFQFLVYFDGSLHHSTFSERNKNIPSIAIGSAVIYTCHDNSPQDADVLMGFGTQQFPIYPDITSADVEYDGFILALGQLHQCLLLYRAANSLEIPSSWDGDIIIRGDCKTIIDQMNGHSTPRKQRLKYNKASEIIQHIFHLIDDDYMKPLHQSVHFIYEHVTRDKNEFCDLLCKQALYTLQRNHLDQIVESIHATSQDSSSFSIANHPIIVKAGTSLKTTSKKNIHPTPFSILLERIVNFDNVHLPISWRPSLYLTIALSAIPSKDPMTLYHVGQLLVDIASKWKPGSHLESEQEDLYTQWLHVGLILQYVGSIHLGLSENEIKKIIKRFPTVSHDVLQTTNVGMMDTWLRQKMEDLYTRSMSLVSMDSFRMSNQLQDYVNNCTVSPRNYERMSGNQTWCWVQ